jgi:hypothetical protein
MLSPLTKMAIRCSGVQLVALDPAAAHAQRAAVALFRLRLEAGDAGRQAQLDHLDLHEFGVVVVGGAHRQRVLQAVQRRLARIAFAGHQPDVREAELAFDAQRVADIHRLDLPGQPLVDHALRSARGFHQAGLAALAFQPGCRLIEIVEAVR